MKFVVSRCSNAINHVSGAVRGRAVLRKDVGLTVTSGNAPNYLSGNSLVISTELRLASMGNTLGL